MKIVRNGCFAGLLASLVLLTGCRSLTGGCCPGNGSGSGKVLRHVVLFKFKDDAPPVKVKEVEDAFRALTGKIDAIRGFEWGTDVGVEDLADGFTHCFLVTFGSEADRDVYLPHPDHKAFVEILKPQLDKVLVVDYWASE